MAITYKRQDELDTLFEQFARIEQFDDNEDTNTVPTEMKENQLKN
ncbi:TPA: SPJ_0845 family protein [Streptococcus suis]